MIQGAVAAHLREALIEAAADAAEVDELFRGVSRRLRRLVPFDAAAWVPTDPATGSMPTAPAVLDGLEHDECVRVWELEMLGEDVNLYADLAAAERPAATLLAATCARPARSGRYREVLRPRGFVDELRTVLRVDGAAWGCVDLYRSEGAFDEREVELLAALSAPLAAAVRRHARGAAPAAGTLDGPGLMLFGRDGDVVAADEGAVALLAELPPEPGPVPIAVAGTVVRARAIAEQRERGPARARIRSRSGRWLACHAACLRDRRGEITGTALVIEPAGASETATLLARAHDLSAREQQISRLIAEGSGTAEIADRLGLSAHTVRDYIKAMFVKVGVSSRGELVARLHAV